MVTADLAADLRERIAAKQIVCVVGAGVVAASARPGPASECALWPRLLESGVRWVRALHPELPASWVDDRLRALASDDVDDLLGVASQVASKLGAPDGGEYAEWLHRSVGALEVGDVSVIQALGALDVPIVPSLWARPRATIIPDDEGAYVVDVAARRLSSCLPRGAISAKSTECSQSCFLRHQRSMPEKRRTP
jgi:hypothetical protein